MIGTNLIQRLCAHGKELVVYSGHAPKQPVEGCIYYQGDVTDYGTLNMVCKSHSIECVIHNAGVSSPKLYPDNPYKVYKTNVIGVLTALEAARNYGVPRFIYVSSAGVYAPDGPVDAVEDSPRWGTLPYRASKICGEEMCRNYGLESVSLRVSYVYGPGRYVACPIREMAAELYEKGSVNWESGSSQRQDYIYVDDVSAGIECVLDAPVWKHREYNLASGELIPFDRVTAIMQKRYPQYSIQVGPGSLGFTEKSLNMKRMAEDFGWQPETTFEEGMNRYLDWLETDLKKG